jgi:beta-lactamase class A
MSHMSGMTRRQALAASSAALLLPAFVASAEAEHPALLALERRAGGRLGVAVLDTASGRIAGHRLNERFGMCSVFKLPLAAVILREADDGRLALDQRVRYGKADMLAHAPVTEKHLARGHMTVAALAEAAQVTSDNPAANLLLKLIGGPAGFTARLRKIGDATTRLDRYEPEMNHMPPGDARDTSTPAAMAALVQRIALDDVLKPATRERLVGWMEKTETGRARLRAGFPQGWRAGDKTGSFWDDELAGKVNDVAVAWPPGGAPLIVTAFYETPEPGRGKPFDEGEKVLAEVGRIAAAWWQQLPHR